MLQLMVLRSRKTSSPAMKGSHLRSTLLFPRVSSNRFNNLHLRAVKEGPPDHPSIYQQPVTRIGEKAWERESVISFQ
jgi:hypothetical protein